MWRRPNRAGGRSSSRRKASLGVIADSWYQLASLHDKAGEYDEAFEALIACEKDF